MRSAGGVVGTAMTGAILLGGIESYAPGSTSRVQAILSGASAAGMPTMPVEEARAVFRYVFAALGATTLVATLLALTIPPVNLEDAPPGI
jgi:hypothetical protein